MSKKTKYSYRAKNKSIKVHRDWRPCTVEEKDRIEKQYPYKFEFKENKPPEPTPSMEKEK